VFAAPGRQQSKKKPAASPVCLRSGWASGVARLSAGPQSIGAEAITLACKCKTKLGIPAFVGNAVGVWLLHARGMLCRVLFKELVLAPFRAGQFEAAT